MSENIASIYIDAKLNTASLQKQLLDLEKQKLTITVDDSQLTDLNKHFDLKRKHYGELQKYFQSSPLVMRVDDSALIGAAKKVKSFSQQSVIFPVEIDDRKIVSSINDLKKLFQAQIFQTQIGFDKQALVREISSTIQGISNNPNLSVNLRLKEGSNSRGSFNEVTAQIKNVERAVRANKPSKQGLLSNVIVGFQEKIGANLQTEINRGIKDIFGKDVASVARSATKKGGKFVKSAFFDNTEFSSAVNEAQDILGDRLRKAAYRAGDGLVAALEDREGDITSKLNNMIKAATKDVDFVDVFKDLQEESTKARKKVVAAVFNEQGLRKVTEPFGDKLRNYRERAIEERALPLVRERAFEILQQKRAKNSAKVVTEDTKELIIASGGYAGARGLSGARLAKEFNAQKVDGRQAIWIKNEDSDIPKESMSKAQDKLIALLTSIGKPNLRGYSLDAMEIASQALAAKEINPNITIKILGESGGGFAAEEANKMLSMLGIQSEFIGIGTPNFVGGFDKKDRKIISPDETLGAETNKVYGRLGLANLTPSQRILGVTGHPYENYRDKNVAELQNFLQGSPGKVTPELMTDFKKGADYFKNIKTEDLDTRQTEQLADAAYANLQHIRRFLLEATGDTKQELEEIVADFEKAFVKLSPESREFGEVRKALNKAKEYLKYLKKQPGVEASIVARQIEKELKKTQEQFNATFGNTTGITQEKYADLDAEISQTREELKSPSIGLKPRQNKLVEAYQAQKDIIGDQILAARTSVDFSAFKKVEEETQELVSSSEEFQEISQDLIDKELLHTRTLVNNFKVLYDRFKIALKKAKKTGNNAEIERIGAEIIKDSALLEAAVKHSKERLNLSGTGNLKENNTFNQQLSVISRYRNTVNKEFKVRGIEAPERQKKAEKVGENLSEAIAIGLDQEGRKPELVMEEIAEKVIKQAEKTFEIESPSKVFQRIGGFISQGLQQGINQNTSGLDDLFSNLLTKASEFKDSIGKTFSGGSAIIQLGLFAATLSKIIPLLSGVANESLEVSNQIQALEKRIQFVSGSKSLGQGIVNQLNIQASNLGLNPANNLDTVSNLLSASKGTPLALEETTKGQLALNQAARVFNLTLEEQGRANVALQQILGKGIVQQEELRGQLSEAIPGATQIAARAFGVTTQELNKMVSSGLDATEFFRKFTDQLDIETAGGVISALGTNQGKQGLAETKAANLKKTFGDVLQPAQSLALDAFNLALDAINTTLPITITLVGALATKMSILATSVIADLIKKLLAAQAGAASFGGTLKVVRGFLISAFKEFAVVAVIGIGINNLVNQFRDLSGELRGQIDAVKSLQNEYLKLTDSTEKALKVSNFDIFKNRLGVGIKSLVTGESKAVKDSLAAIEESMKQTSEIFNTASSDAVQKSLSQLSKIDKSLEDVQAKKRALAINNPEDKEGLRKLDNQQTDLLNQRAENSKLPTNTRKQIASQIEATKAQIEYLEKLKTSYPLYGDDIKRVDARIATLKANSDKLNAVQDDINKKLGESTTGFSLLQKSLQTIGDSYADLNDKATLFNNLQKIQTTLKLSNSNLSSEQENLITQRQERQANENRLGQLKSQYSQTKNLISNQENQQIMQAYNVDFSTGINQLNTLAEQVTNIKDKFVFTTLAQLKQQELEISNLSVDIINARKEAKKQLVDLTKQVSDYYQNISRQSQETALEVKKINLESSNLRLKNQLRESLTNGYETVIGTLVDGVESALDSFTSAADKAIESQQQLLTTEFGIKDATRTGLDLSKQLPKIEVGLDFSSIPDDNNVVKLRDELDNSIGGAENLGKELNFTTATTEELYKALNQAIEPILEQEKQTEKVRQEIDKANESTQNATNSTNNWNNSVTPINQNIKTINGSFGAVNETLGNLINRTAEWVGQLLNAPNLLGNIGNAINGFFGGNSTGDGVTGGFVSPIKGKSLDELISYKPSKGQGFFGMRDGGKRQHSKVDFDSRVGGGQGAEILAAISGTATARMITPISAGVNIEGKDSKGNNITVVYNHLAAAEINKLFNHENGGKGFAPRQLTAGQRLSTVTMDGLSTGAHLDFGIKVNGKYVDPQKWLATEGKAMASMSNQIKTANNQQASNGGVLWGKAANYAPSDLSGLTARGKKALEALKNPNVRATLDAIAIAELGDKAAAKGGYGYLFGDTGGKESFDPNNLKNHPKRRVPFGNTSSSATGRYQTMDFVWQEEAGRLGIKDFKPQSQEIIAVSRLMYRGVLDEVMKGNVSGAIKRTGNKDLSSEWASIEGNPYGQGTVGGKRSTFLNNVSRFASQPVVNAANSNKFVANNQLTSSVQSSTNQAVNSIQVRSQAQQANIQQQIKRDLIAGETALSKVKRATEKVARDSEDSALTRGRNLTDLVFDSKISPTPRDESRKASTDIFRKKADTIKEYSRALTDAQKTIEEANKFIANSEQSLVNETDANRRKVLIAGIEESKKTRAIKLKEVTDLNVKMQQVSEAFDKQDMARVIKFNREAEDLRRTEQRALTDANFASIAFPTKQQQELKASTDIQRQREDALIPLERALEDAKRELANITDASESKIKLKEIDELETKINRLTKAYQGQEKARFDRASFEEYLRSSKAAIQQQTEENNLLQERIAEIEKIKELYPTDSRADVLPALREELELNRLSVDTANKLLEIEEQVTRSGNDTKITEELKKQLATLEQQNDTKQISISLNRQQQEQEIARTKQLRQLNTRAKFSEFDSQINESAVSKLIRNNSKNAFGIDTGELQKARYESFNSQMESADIDFQRNLNDLEEFSREAGLTSEQIETLVNKAYELNQIKLTDLKDQFNDLLDSDSLGELQKVRQNLETQFNLIRQPQFDLMNAQLDQYATRGGNEFVVNASKRKIGREQELFQRDQALLNLDEQVMQARNNGIYIADSEVASMRDAIVEMSEIRLDNLTTQFKDISTTIGDIAKQGLKQFGSEIASLITKGGDLGSIFDNLFENVLNSALNMGINSLLGGLFGGGIGLFYKGQIPNYASGGIHIQSLNKAMATERAMSGRKPQLAVVHENELIIPAGRTEQLTRMGLSPEMLLGKINNHASGQLPKGVAMMDRTGSNGEIKVKTEVINKTEYVSADQLQYAMQRAAEQGAEQGSRKVQMQLQNSTSYRNSVGL